MGMAALKPFFVFIHVVFLLHSGSPLVAGFVRSGNETDRLALLAFKAAITSDPFGALNSWNESVCFCHWVGVACGRRHQRVIVLRLEHQELTGSVSPHVENLSFLRELRLRSNSLSHKIPPELGRLRRLQILTVVNNSITGKIPSVCLTLLPLNSLAISWLVKFLRIELDSLTKLERLLIQKNNIIGGLPYFNSITGNIPYTLGGCKKLEVLRLGVNKLIGTFPFSVYNLSSMRQLLVTDNQIEGSLPSDLGVTLPNLQRLFLTDKLFTGYIPISISNATKLHDLYLGGNSFKRKVPPLEKLHDLEMVQLQANHLGIGEVDDLGFLNSLTNATKLHALTQNSNNFGGILPESISNFSTYLILLGMYGDNIGGSIPTRIGNVINLQLLTMANNHLSGNSTFC